MYSKKTDISSLISSRICHDLVSPLGAIANGLELLELSGTASGPEYTLLNDSVANATARVNYFRYAFGAGGVGAALSENTLRATLENFYADTRIQSRWSVPGDVTRSQAKLALLLIQCLETFLPVGGRITAALDGPVWRLTAQGERLRIDDDKMAHLLNLKQHPDLKPSEIHFELARETLADLDVTLDRDVSDTECVFSYCLPAS
jgi:histidine phosphotransferase ChpT